MKKTFAIVAVVLALAVFGLAPAGLAFDGKGPHHPGAVKNGVTPYGDFCPRCTVYGVGYKPVGHAKAVAAMRAYFGKRGYTIGNVRGIGRFMKVDIYHHGVLVDIIIFDRKTGRIRSIY